MLLSGYPQATLPGLCDRLTSLRNRPRKQPTVRFALPLATIFIFLSFCFGFSIRVNRARWA